MFYSTKSHLYLFIDGPTSSDLFIIPTSKTFLLISSITHRKNPTTRAVKGYTVN